MEKKIVILGLLVVICTASISLIIIKGNPENKVNLNAIAEIGESIFQYIGRTGNILSGISDDEEMDIGDRIFEETKKYRTAKNIEGSKIDIYVNEVGTRVAQGVKRKNIKYKFHLVDSRIPNASASPGGHVYVTLGLLENLGSEAELAYVLGHEIIHIDAGHTISAVKGKVGRARTEGNAAIYVSRGYDMLFKFAYSEAQETEADLGGVYLAFQAGYHPYAAPAAIDRIIRTEYKGYTRAISPVGDTIKSAFGLIGRYFSSHPMAFERIDNIERYIKDKKLMEERSKFYVGEINLKEKISYEQKKIKEEFKAEYSVSSDDNNAGEAYDYNKTFTELNTVYGKLFRGMTMEELKSILPIENRVFERNSRIGYKKIALYSDDPKKIKQYFNIWIDIKENKINTMRLFEWERTRVL